MSDAIYACDYDEKHSVCVGLSGCGMTWTGSPEEMNAEGFVKIEKSE